MNGAMVGPGLLAATFDDPHNARIILLSAAALALLAALITAGTVWWWRSSAVEHPALGPLEVMGSRSWWKGDYASRRRRLEAARAVGAEPVDPRSSSPSEPVDLEAAALASPQRFDDLLEVPVAPAAVQAGDDSDEPGLAVESQDVASSISALDEANAGDATTDDATTDDATTDEVIEQDGTAVTAVPRPIDPLLRLHHDA